MAERRFRADVQVGLDDLYASIAAGIERRQQLAAASAEVLEESENRIRPPLQPVPE